LHLRSTRNRFIEGDNLEALKLLKEDIARRVKLIYLDPPYNTGRSSSYNDDFVLTVRQYHSLVGGGGVSDDTARDASLDGRFHCSWLSMMYPRLRLARELLADDGFLCVSIDDKEVGNLRLIADEVFGASNFIANIIWQKKYTRANDARWFSDNHEHLLCYARDKSRTRLNLIPRTARQLGAYHNPDNHPKGPWKATPLHAKSGRSAAAYTFSNGVRWHPPVGTYRRFSNEVMHRLDAAGEIWFGVGGLSTPARKTFLSEIRSGVPAVTIWTHDEVGHTHEANTELKSLGLGGLFSNPKPTRLVRRIIDLHAEARAHCTGRLPLARSCRGASTCSDVLRLRPSLGASKRKRGQRGPHGCV